MPTERRHRRRWLWLRDLTILALVFLGVSLYQSRGTVRGPAPELAGPDLSGRPVALADYAGRPVLVHFWATWCPVCRAEQGSIESIAGDHAVLSVSIDGSAEELRSYVAEQGIDYPVIHDTQGELAARYGVRGVPASFIVDPEGGIRFVEVGYTTEPGLRARLWWAGR